MIYYLSLGSNTGDRRERMERAIRGLGTIGEVKKVSDFHLTEPWGYREQEDFLNCAVELESALEPKEMLRALKDIERKLGREKTFRWGPRVIDIDILLCFDGDEEISYEDEELIIPHKHLCERNFYLVCLRDLGVNRICGRDIEDLIRGNENAE
jgi:dihydroneopterin aldolase/2-amino-4-hydroxy-6-hydroxymethyldihydropteridine diphosphokinase